MLSSWTSVTGWPRGELNLLMGRPAAEMSCLCRLCPAPAECPGYAVTLVTGRVGYSLECKGLYVRHVPGAEVEWRKCHSGADDR